MHARGSRSIVALVTHARDTPAADRHRFAESARASGGAVVTLVTCHRVEVYGTVDEPAIDALLAARPSGASVLRDSAAIRHLVEVTVGRRSAVVGEDEILHQVRGALDAGAADRPLPAAVTRLFQEALRAGRRARSWQQGRRRSLGDVAVERVAAHASGRPACTNRILVVGAGTMGALAARSAVAAGMAVTIANRDPGHAARLAAAVGGEPVAFDPGDRVATVDGVIVAIGAPWSVAPSTAEALLAADVLVVDLSFPAAVDGLADRLGHRLVTADAIASADLPSDAESRSATDARLDALVDVTVASFVAWTSLDGSRATAAELVRRADLERSQELERLWRRIPTADATTRAAVEEMTRHLAGRLLRPPLEQLGRSADDRTAEVVRELFSL